MKTIVYVDGLNLYYGSLRGTAFKWLDLYTLFRGCVLETDADVEQIRYYTAPIKASSSDDPASPMQLTRPDEWKDEFDAGDRQSARLPVNAA
jgi:hypothetical protein